MIALVRDIEQRHHVRPDRVLGHGEIQPRTKRDPGPRFPWVRLAEAGLITWPDPDRVAARRATFDAALPDARWWRERLAAEGYAVAGADDATLVDARIAFQMKYRPARFDGIADAETAALLDVCTTPGGLRVRAPDGTWRTWRAP